ncbi:hypothetical protein BFP70_10735 [Thioclava sp. SK-1]|nr:hypothetical protein BFP70_10735 [Thioclava sp. SK-1]
MAQYLESLRPAQIRLVAAIAEHGQLQVAASSCKMTQPAASRMLAEIERNLATALFTRSAKGMEPTNAGALLARHATRINHDLTRMAEEFSDLRAGLGGTVRVGAVTGPALGHLVPAIQKLKSTTKGVDISVEVAPSVALVQGLERGDLDFALARLPAHMNQRDFHVEPARDEIVRLLVRDSHPMLAHAPVAIGALNHLPWILQDRGAPIRHAIELAFNDEGMAAPEDITTTSSLLMIIALLKQSDAIAPLSQEVIDLMLHPPVCAEFRVLTLNRFVTVEPFMILRGRGRTLSRAAERLLELTRASIAQFDPPKTV